MSRKGSRVLFKIHNRRGLGHWMRGTNLARAIRSLAPHTEILLYLRSAVPERFRDPDLGYLVEPDPVAASHWPEQVRAFAPDVIVYDTILPSQPQCIAGNNTTRRVYVMRRCKHARQREVFAHPFLEQIDLVLVPHSESEFGHAIPPDLAARTVFTGPIVRIPRPEIHQRLRERYRIRDGDFVVTSSAGGGGFTELADAFFRVVRLAHQQLRPARSNLRHLVIRGPKARSAIVGLEGMTLVESEPDLVDLFALSDVAIAEGGYNTVNELRVTRTPAVFLPSPRNHDDQDERVRRLEAAGLAKVLSGLRAEEAAQEIVGVCLSDSWLRDVRARYQGAPLEPGNRPAAERILELLGR